MVIWEGNLNKRRFSGMQKFSFLSKRGWLLMSLFGAVCIRPIEDTTVDVAIRERPTLWAIVLHKVLKRKHS